MVGNGPVLHSRDPFSANNLSPMRIKQTLILHIPEHSPSRSVSTKAPIITITPYYQPHLTSYNHGTTLPRKFVYASVFTPIYVIDCQIFIPPLLYMEFLISDFH